MTSLECNKKNSTQLIAWIIVTLKYALQVVLTVSLLEYVGVLIGSNSNSIKLLKSSDVKFSIFTKIPFYSVKLKFVDFTGFDDFYLLLKRN